MKLADCEDVLTITELLAVLKIQKSKYYLMRQHGAFPIEPLPNLGGAIRYSKAAVERYLQSQAPARSDRSHPRSTGVPGARAPFPQAVGAGRRGF